MKYKYMHTLDGQPALYVTGEQICFATRTKHGAARLVNSIKDIHREVRLSERWRAKKFPNAAKNFIHGWVKVRV